MVTPVAVQPVVTQHGRFTRYAWTLTATDQVAAPHRGLLGHRGEKSVDVRGAATADGFNGATVEIHGTLDEADTNYKLLNTVPDTVDLTYTAAATRIRPVLPNAMRIKPVVTAGTVGATGVTVVLLVTSALSRAE